MNRTIAPYIHNFGTLTLPEVDRTVLSNGITIHTISGGENDVNRLTITLPGGEAESPKAGLCSLATSMLLEGTLYHTGEEIANILEYNGAWINTSSSTHHSSITLYSLNNRLPAIIDLLVELVDHSCFPDDALNMIKKRRISKIEIDREKVTYHSGAAIRRMIYGEDHPLAQAETPKTIAEITADELKHFHHSRLDTNNVHIFLAGKITPEIMALITTSFSKVHSEQKFNLSPLSFPTISSPQKEVISRPGSLQSAINMAIPSVGRSNPDFVPLRAAVTAFGGYFGSRLMLNIREDKGLTYGISSYLLGYKNKSFIYIATQTDCSKTPIVIEEIYNEIERLKNPATYTEDEIIRLSQFQLSNLASVLDSPFSVMDLYQTGIIADTTPDYFDRQQKLAHNLTPELLADMANKYFDTEQICTAIAGA